MFYFHQTQWDNKLDPSSSCVLTCLAMALSSAEKTITADELWLAAKQRRWDRLNPETVDNLSILYQKPYKIKKDLQIKSLVSGTILYGGWTSGGHCVLVVQVTESGLIYHDPLGVFDGKTKKYDFNKKGERVNASNDECTKYIGKPGEIWGHLPI